MSELNCKALVWQFCIHQLLSLLMPAMIHASLLLLLALDALIAGFLSPPPKHLRHISRGCPYSGSKGGYSRRFEADHSNLSRSITVPIPNLLTAITAGPARTLRNNAPASNTIVGCQCVADRSHHSSCSKPTIHSIFGENCTVGPVHLCDQMDSAAWPEPTFHQHVTDAGAHPTCSTTQSDLMPVLLHA